MVGAKTLELSCLLIFVMSSSVVYASAPAVGGELDLGALSSDTALPITIQGDWLVHVQQFVDADDEAYARPDLIIRNPLDISDYEYAKAARVSAKGHATVSLELRLPASPSSKRWVVELPRSFSSARWEARGYDDEGNLTGDSLVELGTVAANPVNVLASRSSGFLFCPRGKGWC